MKILIIEDDPDLAAGIRNFLKSEDHLCEMAADFSAADEKLSLYEYDIALIDVGLPGGSGLDLIPKLKKINKDTGIIVISAKNSLEDKLSGLDIGADDYITKPFHLTELNSRINAVLRRRKFRGSEEVCFREIKIIPQTGTVMVSGNEVILTRKEFEMLLFFMVNRGRLLTKEAIAEHLWGETADFSDSLDFVYTHINNLRKKIEKHGGQNYIVTKYGMGYKFLTE